jgi:acyl-CoA synthetase (AMP-forming)/AMP-acid ligase II
MQGDLNLVELLDMVVDVAGGRVTVGNKADGYTNKDLKSSAEKGAVVLHERGAKAVIYLSMMHKCFPITIFASAHAGIPFIPLNYRLSNDQLGALLAKHPDPLVITDDRERLLGLGVNAANIFEPDEWLNAISRTASKPLPRVDTEEIAVLLYTSGTTSEPKAVVLRHKHLVAYIQSSIPFASANEDSAALISVPPYHIAGVANSVTSIYSTRRVVYLPVFDPNIWLDLVRNESITHAFLVPTMLARVVDALGEEPARCPSLQVLSYGGARMPITVLERALRAFPEAGFANAYGLTETSSTLAMLTPDDHRAALTGDAKAKARLGSAGKIVPGVEVEIRDGEIWARGKQVSGEYLGQTRGLDSGEWFYTRDRGWIDEDGYLFIEGRTDDTIIRGGENIAPAEIEDALLRHPSVIDAAVVGVPDDEWGQRIEAAVVLAPGAQADAEQLRDHCRALLRSSKTPDRIVMRESLPHTDTGKLLRRQVLADLMSSN